MNNSKYSTMRIVLIFMAILSVVLAVVCIMKTSGSKEEMPQTDLSDYGNEIPSVEQSDGLIYEDDATVEMDSIPNDAMTSGGDIAVSGSDAAVSSADAEQ